jgi:small multidrug resistance pump
MGHLLSSVGGATAQRVVTGVPGLSKNIWVSLAILAAAILAEVCATVSLKLTEGFSRPLPLIVVAVGYAIAFWLLSVVLTRMPIGIVYGIWAGLGIAGVAAVGAILFHEPLGPREWLGFGLVIAGAALLSTRVGDAAP